MDHGNILLHNQYTNNSSGWDEIDNCVIAEYVWIDFSGIGLRSKCRTLDISEVRSLADIPDWEYGCDMHTKHIPDITELFMKPVAYFRDPFRKGNHIIVMTETFVWKDDTCTELIPTNTNFRAHAKKMFDGSLEEEPWFGIEQEYTLLSKKTKH
jgi:glutamine synthetase